MQTTISDSTNGVCVNGTRISEHELADGDLVTFGGAGKMKIGDASPDVTQKSDLNFRFELLQRVDGGGSEEVLISLSSLCFSLLSMFFHSLKLSLFFI